VIPTLVVVVDTGSNPTMACDRRLQDLFLQSHAGLEYNRVQSDTVPTRLLLGLIPVRIERDQGRVGNWICSVSQRERRQSARYFSVTDRYRCFSGGNSCSRRPSCL
jgi:hypothetical protein